MLNLMILFSGLVSAHAIVMEPTFQAAESLGYQIVGEVEFNRDSHQVPPAQVGKQIREIGEMCPRTQAYDPNISSFARFVILSWADLDYPSPTRRFHSAHQQWLAHKRGLAIAEKIRTGVKGNLTFELVNMAHRKPHLVSSVVEGRAPKILNVKETLETAGAAPSDALGYGLFAEYSQAVKAVIWVECRESLMKRKGSFPSLVKLASLGR